MFCNHNSFQGFDKLESIEVFCFYVYDSTRMQNILPLFCSYTNRANLAPYLVVGFGAPLNILL